MLLGRVVRHSKAVVFTGLVVRENLQSNGGLIHHTAHSARYGLIEGLLTEVEEVLRLPELRLGGAARGRLREWALRQRGARRCRAHQGDLPRLHRLVNNGKEIRDGAPDSSLTGFLLGTRR